MESHHNSSFKTYVIVNLRRTIDYLEETYETLDKISRHFTKIIGREFRILSDPMKLDIYDKRRAETLKEVAGILANAARVCNFVDNEILARVTMENIPREYEYDVLHHTYKILCMKMRAFSVPDIIRAWPPLKLPTFTPPPMQAKKKNLRRSKRDEEGCCCPNCNKI